jgi:putative ABC transport system ATP-binding protein
MGNGRRNSVQIVEKAKTLMETTGIGGLESRQITQASGGQLQRVGICRALMNDPRIIFGDEPTGALNSQSSGEIMDLLAEIHRAGTTILLVTHDVKVAAKTRRVLFMLDGKIAEEFVAESFDKSRGDLKAREERLAAWLVDMKF